VQKSDVVMVPLSAPVEAHGETLHALALRVPDGEALCNIGMPFICMPGGGIQMIAKEMRHAIAQLAGIPPSSVNKLKASDFVAASSVVMSFFGEAPTGS
jgi:phosphotransferase system IIA component